MLFSYRTRQLRALRASGKIVRKSLSINIAIDDVFGNGHGQVGPWFKSSRSGGHGVR